MAFLLMASASLVGAQTLQTLCSFNDPSNLRVYPGTLTLGNDGNFYGMTSQGGSPGGVAATVFKVTTNGTLTTLVNFNYGTGASPSALTLGKDGNFYGTAWHGGSSFSGSVFKITAGGTLTTLVNFNYANGAYPQAGLTPGNDGNFYGTTSAGGSTGGNSGTVFQMTTNGALTTLNNFNGINGANPNGLTLGSDGNFYGTTYAGGSGAEGTIFQVTTTGTLTTLVSFNGTDGAYPQAGLTPGKDGNFYGMTYSGGITNSIYPSGMGTIFQVTTNGTLTPLYSFTGGLDGALPQAALTLGNDGNLYGTTSQGDITNSTYINGMGTVFKVTTAGTLTTLYSFSGNDGASPQAALTLGRDGNFYGTTAGGGSSDDGTVFHLLVTPPVITVQPQSQTNSAGATITFSVGATSPAPMSFQWQRSGTNLIDGANISGTTTNALTITGISDSDAVSYSVIVSNINGSVTSSNAMLTVIDPPILTSQPLNLVVLPGTNAAFGVSLSGSAPFFRYQWQFNGTNLLNATNAIYTISSVGTNNAGNYTLVVTNLAGNVTSSNAALTVVLSPTSLTNSANSTAIFTTTIFGPEQLNYQWQKNRTNLFDGGNISGSTNNSLTIANVSDADAAIYNVVVSDAIVSVTTSNAVLTVIDPPVITAQPTNLLVLPGANVAFGVSLTGSASFFRYQWLFNSTNILNATNAIYSIASAGTNKAGNYSVIVTNLAGIATSSNAALSVVLSPASRTNYASSTATFTTTAFSLELLNFHWQKNGTNLVDGGNISGSTNSTLTVSSVSDADAAIYNAVVSDATTSVTTSNAQLTVNDSLFIATQPLSQMVAVGSNVTFTAKAYGVPPFIFQWYFNNSPTGSPASGTNVSSYTLTNVGTNQAGNYSVKVVNGNGNATSSNAILTVVSPPVITAQPASRTNAANSAATFSVTVSSLSALSYQWQQNGTNLVNGGKFSGATTNTLTITGVSSNEAAIYSVAVTNLAGNVASSNATLTVVYPPVITAQPPGQRIVLGNGVAFNVAVSGTAPFNYQWRFNAGNLLNATNASYAISAVGTNHTGNYSVVVTNFAGSVTSSNALLVVLVPPSLALQLWSGYPLLNLNGMLSNNFTVQYSPDLTGTNWITLQTFSNLLVSPYQFLDPDGAGEPARFYRVWMQ
jgi:uncharacterized repeat protein (TIGR03803 family)